MMKPFSMEAVLKYRKRLKDQAMNSFQQAQRERSRAEQAWLRKRTEHTSLVDTLAALENQGVNVDEHIRYQNRIDYVSTELAGHEVTLRKKTETVILRRKQLVRRRKEERALEKLKEKQNVEYQKFIEKKEAVMLDEIALLHRNQKDSFEPNKFL